MIEGAEIIVILLIGLVVLGPRRLPDLARKAGQWSRELRTAVGELRAGLEAEVADVREVQTEIEESVRNSGVEFRSAGSEIRRTLSEPEEAPIRRGKSSPIPAEAADESDPNAESEGDQ